MKRKLFTIAALFAFIAYSFAQDSCTFGTVSDHVGIGENFSTGGANEYLGAADFDVPFGTTFTVSQVSFNVMKGPASLGYVNVAILAEANGLPGTAVETYNNSLPTSAELIYTTEDDENFGVYTVTVNLPEPLVLEKGKYFLQVAANPGDAYGAWWEITAEQQGYGVFDYFKFEQEDWGGTGYYNKVFQVIGSCEDSGETQPDYGEVCEQGNVSNDHENGTSFFGAGQLYSIADDFVVAEGSNFYLTNFTMDALLLEGGIHNATINIRSSQNGAPGEILHSYVNKGPSYEHYDQYWPFPGSPYDVVSVIIDFSFEDEPIELGAGTYFVEVLPTPYATDFLTWELTTQEGIGGNSYTSANGGNTWVVNEGSNQVFTVSGFCNENLGTNNPELLNVSFYPNPVKDVLYISSKGQIEGASLYSVEGKLTDCVVDNNAINMAGFANGIYFLKVNFNNGAQQTVKVIKE